MTSPSPCWKLCSQERPQGVAGPQAPRHPSLLYSLSVIVGAAEPEFGPVVRGRHRAWRSVGGTGPGDPWAASTASPKPLLCFHVCSVKWEDSPFSAGTAHPEATWTAGLSGPSCHVTWGLLGNTGSLPAAAPCVLPPGLGSLGPAGTTNTHMRSASIAHQAGPSDRSSGTACSRLSGLGSLSDPRGRPCAASVLGISLLSSELRCCLQL